MLLICAVAAAIAVGPVPPQQTAFQKQLIAKINAEAAIASDAATGAVVE